MLALEGALGDAVGRSAAKVADVDARPRAERTRLMIDAGSTHSEVDIMLPRCTARAVAAVRACLHPLRTFHSVRAFAMYCAAALIVAIALPARADFGDHLPGLTENEVTAFDEGQEAFSEIEDVADGLGPVFNDRSCAACHVGPGAAVGGNTSRVETRFGTLTGTEFDPLIDFGGSLIQDDSIGRGDESLGLPNTPQCAEPFTFVEETTSVTPANIVAGRRTTPLFGLGLVEAVPDATLIALAASELQKNASTAGVVSHVVDPDHPGSPRIGRFGWKAQHATLHGFSGDAYLNEMGITNPSFPMENCPQGDCSALACNPVPELNDDGDDVTKFADFMRLLAAPPRGDLAPSDKEGETRFDKIGCTDCHTPQLKTGASSISALNNKTLAPYSDFLLHDMGTLGDGITQNEATGRLMRTAPLWGVRVQATLLHDGSALTLTDAIMAHDGQAAASRDKFAGLNNTQKNKVLAFLQSL